MFWIFGKRKQADRSRPYTIKLKRATYAKLSLLAERLGSTEADTVDGAIDFAIASRGNTGQSSGGGPDLASLVSGGEGDSDILVTLLKMFGPQIMQGMAKPATAPNRGSDNQPGPSGPDLNQKMRELGL